MRTGANNRGFVKSSEDVNYLISPKGRFVGFLHELGPVELLIIRLQFACCPMDRPSCFDGPV